MFRKLMNLLRRKRLEADIQEELEFHRHQTTGSFGNVTAIREQTRDASTIVWLETLLQDVRIALRLLRRTPSLTAVALLSTALSVGATAVVFTAVKTVLLKPLPYSHTSELVQLGTRFTSAGQSHIDWVFWNDTQEIIRRTRTLKSVGVYSNAVFDLGGGAYPPQALYGLRMSASGAFGEADLENHVNVTERSLFRTASVAKSITATAALVLAANGRLNLDAPIQDYCPAFPKKPWTITARELLSHRSGIRHYRSETLDDPEVSSTHHYANLSDAFELFGKDPLVHQPGTAFLYSTFGYTVLGCVLEGAARESFPALMSRYVFAPADMRDSTIDDARRLIPNRVRGYDLGSNGQLENAPCIDSSDKYPAGGLLTTAFDLAHLIQHLYSGTLLPSKTLQEMWEPATILSKGRGYALGWGTFTYRGMKAIAHSGDQQGAQRNHSSDTGKANGCCHTG
ncbi:MAG: serine hydrolase [Acidobacteriota bacterium]|nr:serine hydrolase [Acidobacteriota bacterium]MDQ2840917.1 serine hydrolase [Acidobacteriota bacterium]